MRPQQLAALLDSAMRISFPLSYLDAVVTAFRAIGRHQDSVTTAWVGCLYAEGEIDILMSLRAAWLRGDEASAGAAARRVTESSRLVERCLPSDTEDGDCG